MVYNLPVCSLHLSHTVILLANTVRCHFLFLQHKPKWKLNMNRKPDVLFLTRYMDLTWDQNPVHSIWEFIPGRGIYIRTLNLLFVPCSSLLLFTNCFLCPGMTFFGSFNWAKFSRSIITESLFYFFPRVQWQTVHAEQWAHLVVLHLWLIHECLHLDLRLFEKCLHFQAKQPWGRGKQFFNVQAWLEFEV